MTKKKPTKKPRARSQRPPAITDATVLKLYVAAGGRCSFPGCLEYLMEEPLTKKPARLANVAHIVAESKDGPRGAFALPMKQRSEFGNLMLACTTHHTFIDKKAYETVYPVEMLHRFKLDHETHMKRATGSQMSEKTHAVRLVGQIRDHVVGLSDAEIRDAIFEHEYRHVEQVIDIDLSALTDSAAPGYVAAVLGKIDEVLQRQILPAITDGSIKRLSVFALARIPFLTHLGYALGDKVPTVLYQKHRDGGEGWRWPKAATAVDFEVIEHGPATATRVAVLAGVSGGDVDKVRQATSAERVYQIHPIGEAPSRTLLRSPATLENFRRAYHEVLSRIETRHTRIGGVDYFLAVPAPIAVMCGRDVLRDVVPDVVVHDLVNGAYVAVATLKTRTRPHPA